MAARNPYDFGTARRALAALLENPDDTSQVFHILRALSGRSADRTLSKLRRSAAGRRLLQQQPRILDRLRDRAWLADLPAGSVGRAYLEFLDTENITAEGLVAASEAAWQGDAEPDIRFVSQHLRDTHDLWHVVTGYHGDLLGEVALLAFSLAQAWSLGLLLIVSAGWLRGGEVGLRGLTLQAYRRGQRARWLPEADWEALLPLPLDVARRRLRLSEPPCYTPIRTSDLAGMRADAA